VSNGPDDLTGSAARQHEQTGGNVQAGGMKVPFGGDAARRAESEGEAANRQYRGSMQLSLPKVVGARVAEPEKPAADLSQRKASDYLPPQLKAQLIAEGKLGEDGSVLTARPATAQSGATETRRRVEAAEPAPDANGGGVFGTLTRFLKRLFQ
jgi:hypothetical protein